MENKFNNRDFEQFVKQNADQYRMFPSEKVWEGINNTINTRRKWYGIGLALLLLTTGTVTWVMLSPSNKKQQLASVQTTPKAEKKQEHKPEMIIAQAKPANNTTSFITSSDRLQKTLLSVNAEGPVEDDNTTSTIAKIEEVRTPAYTEPAIATQVSIQPELTVKPLAAIRTKQQVAATVKSEEKTTAANVNAASFSFDIKNTGKTETAPVVETFSFNKNDIYPLTIESVINSYRYKRSRKKLSWQIFITPTVSYRKLKENKGFLNAARPYTASNTNNFTDVNSVVTHKPDIGVQLGFTAGYPLSKRLRITGGLQINVSKYDILAFTYPSEVTTIALSNSSGGSNTVSTFTNYRNRNSGGSSNADWLRNLYTSASAPIGLELKLLGNKRSYVGIAGTVQPTYILSNRAYLISTDYKNYAEVPSLVRKWNINTGFEIFAGYSTGKLNWRFSPQVRYQTLSSFVDKYPVKEHLFDFGVKLGLMLK